MEDYLPYSVYGRFSNSLDVQQTFPFSSPSRSKKFSLVVFFSTTFKTTTTHPPTNPLKPTTTPNLRHKSYNIQTLPTQKCHPTSASPPHEEVAQAATSNATSRTSDPATKSNHTRPTTAFAIASANQTRTSSNTTASATSKSRSSNCGIGLRMRSAFPPSPPSSFKNSS